MAKGKTGKKTGKKANNTFKPRTTKTNNSRAKAYEKTDVNKYEKTGKELIDNSDANYRVANARAAMDTLRGATDKAQMDTTNYFNMIDDYNDIVGKMNQATQDAYDVKMREANLGMNKAENTSYNNTQNALRDLKNSMIGSASSGANQGSANATALQAMLGLGQQNKELVTEGLNNIYGISGERAAAMSKNAADAIGIANEAKNNMLTAATQRYGSDNDRSAAALSALGQLGGTMDTNSANIDQANLTNTANIINNDRTAASNESMNIDTARGNIAVAKTPQVTKNTNVNQNNTTETINSRTTNVNKNINSGKMTNVNINRNSGRTTNVNINKKK